MEDVHLFFCNAGDPGVEPKKFLGFGLKNLGVVHILTYILLVLHGTDIDLHVRRSIG